MDAALLTSRGFWEDPAPPACGLAGHVLFETSGSSGRPKQVAISKQALLVSAEAVNRHLQVTRDSRWGLALPLNHVGGFGVAARAYQAGCCLSCLEGRWNPEDFRKWIEDENVTHTSLVPTQVHDLVKAGLTAPSLLTAIVVGGGRLDNPTGQAARDLGWPVLASYGMTEAGSQIATQGLELLDSPYQSAPLPLLPIWEAGISENGRLRLCGSALFSGYVEDGNFTPRDSAWHTTSDIADLDGRSITPRGRADNLVKILGELVDVEAVERELVECSDGQLVAGTFAVVAIPDERAEHALIPVFETKVSQEVIARALAIHAARSPGFRRLRPGRTIEELPRGELGKLRRGAIADICPILKVVEE